MSAVKNSLQVLDPNRPLMGFDPINGEIGCMTPIEIQQREKTIQVVSIKMILTYSLLGAIFGFTGGKIGVFLGASQVIVKYITTGGSLLGTIAGYLNKVEKKISVSPYFQTSHLRMERVELDPEKDRKHMDEKSRQIMKDLFNSVEKGASITCPISGELLQIPVEAPTLYAPFFRGGVFRREAHGCGSFEYLNIKRVIEQKGRCPTCHHKMYLTDLRVNSKKVAEVARVVNLSFMYLIDKKNQKHTIDTSFSEDSPELDAFILLRKQVDWYNARINITRQLIALYLLQKIKELGEPRYFNFHERLIHWTRAFEIKLPESEERTETSEDSSQILDANSNSQNPENSKKPLLDDDSKEKEGI